MNNLINTVVTEIDTRGEDFQRTLLIYTPQQPWNVDIVIPILQMNKLRCREINWKVELKQGSSGSKALSLIPLILKGLVVGIRSHVHQECHYEIYIFLN